MGEVKIMRNLIDTFECEYCGGGRITQVCFNVTEYQEILKLYADGTILVEGSDTYYDNVQTEYRCSDCDKFLAANEFELINYLEARRYDWPVLIKG